jgi:large subunit ribosomal protein L15
MGRLSVGLHLKKVCSEFEGSLKVLGNGTLEKKLTIRAAAFSGAAREKIEQAGGKAEVV